MPILTTCQPAASVGPMLADRIRQILRRRPYWGPQTVAKAAGASSHVVRVVASREKIAFMDRYEVEAYVDALVDRIEALEVPDGKKE
jgi:hypothetical protein